MTLSKESHLPSIGGYLELEIPKRKNSFLSQFYKFQSARSAFLALLKSGKPKRVWIPNYICSAMLAPLTELNIEHIFYDVDENLNISPRVSLQTKDWLLYINYFGICDHQIKEILSKFNPKQIVLDYSQAFFSHLYNNTLATIYSPRKFFGIPDGGLLYSHIPIEKINKTNITSFSRTQHLLQRLGGSAEDGYGSFLAAEESLCSELEPQKMSALTERILHSIDFKHIYEKRRQNFQTLHRLLESTDPLLKNTDEIEAPLFYPYFTPAAEKIKINLINNRIFIATYWADAANRMKQESIDRFIKNMLPLPIDHRYGKREMKHIASIVKNNQEYKSS